jgi:Flp pilus assembly protein CpaB
VTGRQRWRRTLLRRRRSLAALLAGVSVLLALTALRPAPGRPGAVGPTLSVLVAGHDLAAGVALRDGDVRVASYPAGLVPDGALRPPDAVAGRRPVLPIRTGEPLTDVRLVSNELLERLSGPGSVAAPVRIADAGEVTLVRPGDRVDVLAAPTSDGSGQSSGSTGSQQDAVPVATGAMVLSAPQAATSTVADGGLVLLAVAPQTARALAGAAASDRLSLVLRP